MLAPDHSQGNSLDAATRHSRLDLARGRGIWRRL